MSLDVVPFSIFGSNVNTSGAYTSTDLFVHVTATGSANEYMNLYISGAYPLVKSGLNLYIQNNGSSGWVPLHVQGLQPGNTSPYSSDGYYPGSGDMNLFISRILSDYVPLFIQHSIESGNLPLYVSAATLGSGNQEVFTALYSWETNNGTADLNPGAAGHENGFIALDPLDYNGQNIENIILQYLAPSTAGEVITFNMSGLNTSNIFDFHTRYFEYRSGFTDLSFSIEDNFADPTLIFSISDLIQITAIKPRHFFPINLFIQPYSSGNQPIELYTHGF
jgi:hypothetical protein